MKVLITASEMFPIYKLGGLGDVIGSLPKALDSLGVNVDVIIPFYHSIDAANSHAYKSFELIVPFNNKSNVVQVYKCKIPKSSVNVFLLKNDTYFSSKAKSETETFVFFDKAVVEYIKLNFNTYDLIHCNDWHTGMIPNFLKEELGRERPKVLFTIHNLMYQGVGDTSLLKDSGIVPGSNKLIDFDTMDGDLNMLMQGILGCDFISTVSPTYANEILTLKYGGFLSSILKDRVGCLTGILNGIDYTSFPTDINDSTWLTKKKNHKKSLLNKLKLSTNSEKPLFSFVGRLDNGQKGLDILYDALPVLAKNDCNFVLLGTGDPVWEAKFKKLATSKEFKNNVSINISFNLDFANSIYAGSDFFLVPSKYEPCGLTQMISMHYGTLPIVRSTGGLKDSVHHLHNGFVFEDYSAKALKDVLEKSIVIYNTVQYPLMVSNALQTDFSWIKSAKSYLNLYVQILGKIS